MCLHITNDLCAAGEEVKDDAALEAEAAAAAAGSQPALEGTSAAAVSNAEGNGEAAAPAEGAAGVCGSL